ETPYTPVPLGASVCPKTPFPTPVVAAECPYTPEAPPVLFTCPMTPALVLPVVLVASPNKPAPVVDVETPVMEFAAPVTLIPPGTSVIFEFANVVLPDQTAIFPLVPLPVTCAPTVAAEKTNTAIKIFRLCPICPSS